MNARTILRVRRRLLLVAAAFPVCQFFSGCFPNIPGVPNIPGAINLELQNLINGIILDTVSVIIQNILDL